MSDVITRRSFTALAAGAAVGSATSLTSRNSLGDEKPQPTAKPEGVKLEEAKPAPAPQEMPFERDYAPPDFKPSWKRPQLNRTLVQDFVIFAHSDLEMTKKLLEKEPGLIAATVNWGAGDWESGLGGASHMGRRDIVELLLEHGARVDLFCAAMLGQLDVIKSLLTLQPKLIDAKGPHGFTLHFHAQVGGLAAEPVLDYLESIKKLDLKPNPFLRKPAADTQPRT